MTSKANHQEPLFEDLKTTIENESPITEVESLCMNCHENGITKLILTRIPFYKDLIISSFACNTCSFANNEIQSANKINDNGILLNLFVNSSQDLNRQVVKSDYATLKIPEIDLEIPEQTQKSTFTTIEGILNRINDNLQADVQLKEAHDPELCAKLKDFLIKINELKELKKPFRMIIDDPSGESFIQNLNAPAKDPHLSITFYKRTQKQNELIGVSNENESIESRMLNKNTETKGDFNMKDEVVQFLNNCPNCSFTCETNMKVIDIPFFKEVIVMSTACDACGHKSNEIKSGAGISQMGKKYILKLTDSTDMNRDVLKSETASLEIPEIEFYVHPGTIGGKFTTLEGLLKDCGEQLGSSNPFMGDSAQSDFSAKMKKFLTKLDEIQQGRVLNVTVILDDPCGNSYLQNIYAPHQDPHMQIIEYERTSEQDEWLGLNDIKTENYC